MEGRAPSVFAADWRAAFDAVDADDADGVAAVAQVLLASGEAVTGLLGPLVAALRDDPAFEPPFHVHRDGLRIGAVLIDHPAVTITASITAAAALAALPAPATIVVPGRIAVTRYHRGGGARLQRWSLDADGLCRRIGDLALADGMIVHGDGRRQATLLVDAASDVVALTATIRAGAAAHMREHDRVMGAPIRLATLDEAASRTAMLLTLLRVTGRHDAGALFETTSHAGAADLRWSAMREWLALDVRAALPRLRTMAMGDPQDEVRSAARTMLAVAEARIAA